MVPPCQPGVERWAHYRVDDLHRPVASTRQDSNLRSLRPQRSALNQTGPLVDGLSGRI